MDNLQMDRATVLTEALPYIQKYTGRTVVVKYGGEAMNDEGLRRAVISDLVLLHYVGIRVVLVHEESAERVNREIVATMNRAGGKALGFCGVDGSMITVRGGVITGVDPVPLADVIERGYIPVVTAVGLGQDTNAVYELDADLVAARLAVALGAERLLLLADVRGVLRTAGDENTLMTEIQLSEVPALVQEGVIRDEMVSRVNCGVEAARSGVKAAVILDGRVPHSILLELLSDAGNGTMLVK